MLSLLKVIRIKLKNNFVYDSIDKSNIEYLRERIKVKRNRRKIRSSEQERMVDALALDADEGRD